MIKTALVVDDSKSARFALRKFLEGFNYKVETADSAAEAYRQLAGVLPDVIFLDHIMPGVDGFEALKVMKSDPLSAKVPVVICSSNEGEDFVHQAKLRGATDVLQKPPSPEQIAGVLANLGRDDETDFLIAPAPVTAQATAGRESPAMERLKAALPAKPVAAPAPPPVQVAPAPSKVQPIREPAVAIQQAVMKSLRDAIPQAETRSHPMPDLPAVPTLFSETLGGPDASAGELREQLESQMQQLRQDLQIELASLRNQLSGLASSPASLPEERIRNIALEAAKTRTNALAQTIEQHLTALQTNLDGVLRAQNERLDQALQMARQAAAEEAERVVMNAAQRIADQMAGSLLKTMGQQLSTMATGRSNF